MNIDEAHKILAEQDTTDPARALEAVAAVARHWAIAHPSLLSVAEDLEQVAQELRRRLQR